MEFALGQQQQPPLWSLAGAEVVDVGEPHGQDLWQHQQPLWSTVGAAVEDVVGSTPRDQDLWQQQQHQPLWSTVGAEVVDVVGTRPRHRVRRSIGMICCTLSTDTVPLE